MQGLEAGQDEGAGHHLEEVVEQVQSGAGVGVVSDGTASARIRLSLGREDERERQIRHHVNSCFNCKYKESAEPY